MGITPASKVLSSRAVHSAVLDAPACLLLVLLGEREGERPGERLFPSAEVPHSAVDPLRSGP
jgi:hypothetical protein